MLYTFYTATILHRNLLTFTFSPSLHFLYLPIHSPPIPQPLPEVPVETGEAIEKASVRK